jgi:hypothetical protein
MKPKELLDLLEERGFFITKERTRKGGSRSR